MSTNERDRHPVDAPVDVVLRGLVLSGHLSVPADARGVVLFAHGAASDHRSERNGFVARRLVHEGIGALLFDLQADPQELQDRATDPACAPTLRELEAARYRVAQINGCVVCKGTRGGRDLPGYIEGRGGSLAESPVVRGPAPGEDFYEAVDQWRTSSLFSERERIAIDYGERLATNHLSIDDAYHDRLRQYFTEPEIVELGMFAALCVGYGRLGATWDMVEELPARFQDRDKGAVTPWGGRETVMVR